MPNNEFSLENLTQPGLSPDQIQAAFTEFDALEQSYKNKYGPEEGERQFYAALDKDNERLIRKDINERIYCTGQVTDFFNRTTSPADKRRFKARRRELYGAMYDTLMRERVMYDPRVAELLIQDAIKTGAWDELPDDLQPVYWARVGGGV